MGVAPSCLSKLRVVAVAPPRSPPLDGSIFPAHGAVPAIFFGPADPPSNASPSGTDALEVFSFRRVLCSGLSPVWSEILVCCTGRPLEGSRLVTGWAAPSAVQHIRKTEHAHAVAIDNALPLLWQRRLEIPTERFPDPLFVSLARNARSYLGAAPRTEPCRQSLCVAPSLCCCTQALFHRAWVVVFVFVLVKQTHCPMGYHRTVWRIPVCSELRAEVGHFVLAAHCLGWGAGFGKRDHILRFACRAPICQPNRRLFGRCSSFDPPNTSKREPGSGEPGYDSSVGRAQFGRALC